MFCFAEVEVHFMEVQHNSIVVTGSLQRQKILVLNRKCIL